MLKKTSCLFLSILLIFSVLSACGQKGVKVNEYMLSLEGKWEYTDETGSIAYTFKTDGTGAVSLFDQELPFTFSANDVDLKLVVDYTTFYEAMYSMDFDDMVDNGMISEQYRKATENYSYVLGENTLTITDTAYSQMSGSDIATLVLTKES